MEASDSTQAGGQTSTAMAGAIPPSQVVFSHRINDYVFQSVHSGQFMNNGAAPVQVGLTASLIDASGAGNSAAASETAEPFTQLSMGLLYCEIPVSSYASGTQVTLTAATVDLGGGAADRAVQQNTLTVP